MEDLFKKLNELISIYDNFIIMGHKDPDLDSLGASLGLSEIIESFGKSAYIFLNYKSLNNYNNNIKQALNKMEKKITFIDSTSYKKVKGKNLLIVLDTHLSDRLEYSNILNEMDVIILDHHIKNKNYIKDSRFMYLDSNLSSMSEFVAYYSEYLNIDLDNVISTVLLAGIEIDTSGFNLKTTSHTYEAASILMEMGADSILKQELLKETKEDYIKRANFIRNSFMINDCIAMCIIYNITTNVDLAEIAEELLTFEDVEASFTIGKLDSNVVGISARSLGNIDVSKIIIQLGGGGHVSNAAAQILNKSIKEVKQEIIEIINQNNADV